MNQLLGLQHVKAVARQLHTRVRAEQRLPESMRVPTKLNFSLMGNPGTGKTTVARLLGKLLHGLGLRKGMAFVETTGETLLQMKPSDVPGLIDSAKDGVLFIDEAYTLEPSSNAAGKAVINHLMTAAEDQRDQLSIFFAGYKDDIEQKLYGCNPGMKSRFNDLIFEDFTRPELMEIWLEIAEKHKWRLEPHVAEVASRRIDRRRGVKGFANARDVRNLFEEVYPRALDRIEQEHKAAKMRKAPPTPPPGCLHRVASRPPSLGAGGGGASAHDGAGADDGMLKPTRAPTQFDDASLVIKVVDVLGPPPSVERVPDLKAALSELNREIGLKAVKEQAHRLVKLAEINYQRELNCEEPYKVPLNRLFLGNPGTGKTTVAKIYGRILKGLGYLSDGSVEEKTPSDLIASAAGGTEEKTAALLEICKGKVLVIDEAYGLHEGLYGARAIDTIVSKVHNSPGEDIAVLLLGYEDKMMKMLREANPGLMSRFSPDSAFRFEDFTDSQLVELLHKEATLSGLSWGTRSVCLAARDMLIRERIKPHFGNARAVKSLMGRVKEALAARGDARAITLADLGLEEGASGGTAKTASLLSEVEKEMKNLFKTEGLQEHFKSLTARLTQLQRDGQLDPSMPADKVGHYILVGNAGTGKTTFARVLGKWLRAKGVLVGDGFVEQSALNLQGEYLGHTKKKVDDLMSSAPGGMVFIDEAYNLGGGGMRGGLFAKEAVDQLTFNMTEPQYKGKSIVVLAGYEKDMEAMLDAVNPGFRSRFKQRIILPDWDTADVVEYLCRRCAKEAFVLTAEAQTLLKDRLALVRTRPGWANARDAEWLYDELAGMRAERLASAVSSASEEQPTFTLEDARGAMDAFDRRRPPPRDLTRLEAELVRPGAHVADDDGANGAPPMEEGAPPCREVEVEREEIREVEEVKVNDADGHNGPDVAAALQEACVELGYDESNPKRKELVAKLTGCEGSKDFPDDILGLVCQKTGKEAKDLLDELRAQVPDVLSSMREAIKEAETEQHRLDAAVREKIKEMCLCPAGFDWHREGDGWRCNGGSHFLSNAELNAN